MAIMTVARCHEMYLDENGNLTDIIPPPENDEWFRGIVAHEDFLIEDNVLMPGLLQQFLNENQPNQNPIDIVEQIENDLFNLMAQQIFMQFQANNIHIPLEQAQNILLHAVNNQDIDSDLEDDNSDDEDDTNEEDDNDTTEGEDNSTTEDEDNSTTEDEGDDSTTEDEEDNINRDMVDHVHEERQMLNRGRPYEVFLAEKNPVLITETFLDLLDHVDIIKIDSDSNSVYREGWTYFFNT